MAQRTSAGGLVHWLFLLLLLHTDIEWTLKSLSACLLGAERPRVWMKEKLFFQQTSSITVLEAFMQIHMLGLIA